MAALIKLFASWLYVVGIFANFRLSGKKCEGIVKLLQIFISLSFSPLFSGKSTDLNYVFPGGGGKQKWAH